MLVLSPRAVPVPLPRMVDEPVEIQGPVTEQRALGLALRKLRKRADMTQKESAEHYGVDVVSWRRYELGQRDLGFSQLERLAAAVRASRDELISEADKLRGLPGVREERAPFVHRRRTAGAPETIELPIRDRIRAGSWAIADDLSQRMPKRWPAAKDPRFPHAEQWLDEVDGDSMNALIDASGRPAPILDGDLVHVVDAVGIHYFPKTGDIVEVQRTRGDGERELTIKQVEVTRGDVLLWPRSTNPAWQTPVPYRPENDPDEQVEVRIRGLVVGTIRRFF